jgi:deoxycytidine triphosphate deaminase
VNVSDSEREVLSRARAAEIADAVRGKSDPFPRIPPSLLSAEHIRQYVEATGLIAPFFEKGGKKSRLKKASYEGRIGSVAYEYRNDRLEEQQTNGRLKVGANSIVFVECDLDFRLPEYIALRFNLQIKHVHRGLLLGTGPLVDPGFWGKLCIPLHNLTSEDYYISSQEGLIWIEFTKTTSDLKDDADALGRIPTTSGHWNIRDFILKASNDNGTPQAVPIQSSIPKVFIEAAATAKEAQKSAQNSQRLAEQSKRNNIKITVTGIVGAIISVAAFVIAMYQLVDGQKSFSISQLGIYKDYIDSITVTKQDLNSTVEKWQGEFGDLRKDIAPILEKSGQISDVNTRLQQIELENARLKSEINRISTLLAQSRSKQ